ncbi:MFS transporter [Saccharicrinis sp. FJH62]|uniref:MFS transporter n=1 Tax=Saccharicrinis sp. FJH62 TaxID=3344657 RepID=UPI0035D51CDC
MNQSVLKDSRLYIIFGITLFGVSGVASLAPAFPVIMEQFGLNETQVGYLITVFTVPGIVLTPVMGILADRYGRKTILIPSMALFGIGGFLCAFQETYQMLLVMRFIQGVGASALGSLNVTLIGDLFEGKRRGEVMGLNASVLSIGTASFPAIGGALAAIDWRTIFYIPALIIPLIAIVYFNLNVPALKGKVKFWDYMNRVWDTINRKIVWGLFISNILAFVVLYGAYLTFLPLMVKERFDVGTLTIGSIMSLMSITTALTSSQYSRIVEKFTTYKMLYASSVLYAISLSVYAFADSWPLLILATILFGLAHGSFIPNVQTMLVGLAPLSERAAFMSVNGMVLRIGQSIGPVFAAFFFIGGHFSYVFLISAVLALSMFVFVKFMVLPEPQKT